MIVLVFNLSSLRQTADQLAGRLHPLLRDRLLLAGTSTTFHDFKGLYYYYTQAHTAIELGKKHDPTKWYFAFEEYQIDYLLERYQARTIPDALIPAGLKRLIEHDRAKNSTYVQTLRVYLEQERNVAATTRILYIHRNTFDYRIKRIQEILGINLNNAENRIILQLALRILKPLENDDRSEAADLIP